MKRWLQRLFWLAVISGAGFAVWTALQRRNELPATPSASPSSPPAPPPAPAPASPTSSPPPSTTTPSDPRPAAEASQPATWREPVEGACPEGYPIKVAKSGIYHVPGGRSYDRTAPERCYVNGESAEADGYRRAKS